MINYLFQVFQLKQHCRSLEGELDGVKSEIVRIITEKDGFLRENGFLKDLKMERDDLKEENKKLKLDLRQLIEEKKHNRSPNPSQANLQLQLSNRSSPDGQEIETVLQEMSFKRNYKDIEALKHDRIMYGDFKIQHFLSFFLLQIT